MRAASRSRRRHRGYALVFFALMLFAIFAMAALVIDIGFRRLAYRQLQTAAQSASLEGLRGRGVDIYEDRMERAQQMFAWHFDDDLDLDTPPGSGMGKQFIVEETGVIPRIKQLSVAPSSIQFRNGNRSVGESNVIVGYARGELSDEDYDAVTADFFATGPAIPYLFAHGSLLHPTRLANAQTILDRMAATADPVVYIGPPNANTNEGQGTSIKRYAISIDDWSLFPSDDEFIRPSSMVKYLEIQATPLSVGTTLGSINEPTESGCGYCPVYQPSTLKIVGFAWLQCTIEGENVLIKRIGGGVDVVALQNASCHRSLAPNFQDMATAHAAMPFPLLAPRLTTPSTIPAGP